MNIQSDTQKKQLPLLTCAIIFIVGFLCGVAFTVYKTSSPANSPAATGQSANPSAKNSTEAIARLEAEVTAHPDKYMAWVELGNLYYDSEQPEKAIAAYNKSLEYHGGTADLLTDLGNMYRAVKQPEKAIASFDKARTLDARHQQSRFNKGVVLLYDKGDVEGAIASWQELLAINPEAKAADGHTLKEMISELQSHKKK